MTNSKLEKAVSLNEAPGSSEAFPAFETMRLQKFLARAGVASRRASEQLILDGRVAVNGKVVTELGTKVRVYAGETVGAGKRAEEGRTADNASVTEALAQKESASGADTVTVDGAAVTLCEETVTLMLNKPAGYVTTMDDPQGRACVASLVPLDRYPSLFPVGRLDRDTTGLLLFSTDGQLGNRLLHPRHHVSKTYLALTLGIPTEQALETLRMGVELSDGITQPACVDLLSGEEADQALSCFEFDQAGASGTGNAARKMQSRRKTRGKQRAVVRITIAEGRNRQVRRMLDAVGCPVIALHRCSFGQLTLDGVSRGAWRLLSAEEVAALEALVE